MLTHYSKKLIFPMLVCAATVAHAEVVSVDTAKQLAAEFFNASSNNRLASADALDLTFTGGTASRPYYYVFNARDGHGYIIVSADDCTTPVLGYSEDGRYNPSSVPPVMKWMLSGLEREIKAAPGLQRPVSLDERRRQVRRAAGGNERILLNTPEWRQEAPFNRHIPGNALTGCVGTAMAMIMKYHAFPERGTGSYNGVNFDVAYDWYNMRMDAYRSGYTEAEAEAVSTLIYHTAASIGTQFGYSGSSAYEVKVPAALINYFGYDPGVSYKKRSETATQAEFDRLVENEIRAKRPVLYCGQDVTAGHAFVVDGYDPLSGMIHVNWGWGGADGNNNGGWYASTALNPTVSQSHSFNNLTTIIYNIKPGNGSNSAWSPLHITADGRQPGMSSDLEGDLEAGKNFVVRVGNIKNLGYDRFSGKFAVALFDAAGAFKCTLSKVAGMTLNGMALYPAATVAYTCSLPAGVAVADGDMIRMATSTDDGTTWLPLAGELVTVNEIPAKGAVPQYFAVNTPGSLAGAAFTGENRVIKGWNYTFRVVPASPDTDVVTVKANGYLVTAGNNYTYTIGNVLEDQDIAVYVQPASEVKEKRSVWVGTPGTLETIITGADAGTIKDLTIFGTIDARDFAFMKSSMKLTRLDLSGVTIAANGTNQANAVPREAFRNLWNLKEVILPASVNRLNNGCFRSCGITSIVIPAAVSTYEYNVFNGASYLRDVWVRNPTPAFVNWCVFRGTPADRTVHCINMGAEGAYKSNQYWNQPEIDSKVKFTCPWNDKQEFPTDTDYAFAVMEDPDVKYTCDTPAGRYVPGTKIVFRAEHIADDDNRMDVYANATLLKPDAEGKYSITVNRGTIIHFDLVEPTPVSPLASPWVLTDATGSVGLFTDMVNVVPGVTFSIRANAFDAPSKAFWAAVLTTADGRIKEFISPIGNWSAEPGTGFKMNINCCVKDATVREGNLIRLVTSIDKKTWKLVEGANDNVVAAIPALNNATPVYNFTFPEGIEAKANLSGVVASAVRGRDLTFKIVPKNATHVITMLVNGMPYAKETKSVTYSFIAKEDINFDVRVIAPDEMEAAVFDLKPGEHLWDPNNTTLQTERVAALRPKVVVKGSIDRTDFTLFRQTQAWNTVVSLDLSGATIVADRTNPTGYPADEFPAEAFCETKNSSAANIKLKDLKFPVSVRRIGASALIGCSQITELELPVNLYNDEPAVVNGKNRTHQGGLKRDCFKGCDKLTTLYCYAAPRDNKVHLIDFNSASGLGNNAHNYPNTLGITHHAKVTVVVKPEYYSKYTTPHETNDWYGDDWINGWMYLGFNMAYDYPVYGVNYDVTRCFTKDAKLDVTRVVSFLGDNVSKDSQDFSGQLCIAAKSNLTTNRPEGVDAYDPNAQVKVYDNGKLLTDDKIAADGTVTITYYNPNDLSRKDLVGNHNIDVVYLYNVTFRCASANLYISPEVRNNEADGDAATDFEVLNYFNPLAPVLESVREESQVRFKVELKNVDAAQLRPVVKVGETVLAADDEGYYTLAVTDADVDVNVYTVPVNNACLSPAEAEIIDAGEAVDVTAITLTSAIKAEKVKEIIDKLPALEQLDLSGLTEPLPDGAMAGKETLVTVMLPAAEAIEANTFAGCTNLASVVVPECVDVIGENAFKGCASLKNLSFSGITGVGANAFDGCGSLTSIIFTSARPDAAARVRRRAGAPRVQGYDQAAFEGLNPNCIVYLDEGVELPSAKGVNFVLVSQDAAAASGRVYEAAGDITIDPSADFRVINAFKVPEVSTISMAMELSSTQYGDRGWKSFVVPFMPDEVLDAAGNRLSHYARNGVSNDHGLYMTASLNAEGNLELTDAIKANTPYLVSLLAQEGGVADKQVTFVAGDCEVPQTPEEMRVEGADYALVASLDARTAPAATTYVLSSDGSTFEMTEAPARARAEADTESLVAVKPFSVYAVSDSEVASFPISVDVTNEVQTGIDADGTVPAFMIIRENGALIIYSDTDTDVEVYGINGMHMRTLHLTSGRNEIDTLVPGVYIIRGQKVVL